MAQKIINARAKNKRDTSANWTAADPVLLDGEIIIVDTAEGEVRTKIGDGTKKYSQLPFEDEKLRNLLNNKLDKTATAANSSKLNGQEASYYATDSNTVHKAGNETIAGVKTFSGKINGTAGATIKTSGNAILNVETIPTDVDYAHLYTSGTSNNKRPLVLNASPDGSGPVGIGVVQPTEKLEVAGNIKTTGKIIVGTAPTNDLDVATKKYVDDLSATKQAKITSLGLLKGDGAGNVSAATANTDYLPATDANLQGTPTAPTAAKGTNTTQVATTAFVQNALSGISAKGFEFGTTAPKNTNLLWIDTTNGSILKYYNGSAWTAVNAVFK